MAFLSFLRQPKGAFGFLLFVYFAACVASAEDAPLRIPRVSRPPKLSDFIDGTPREAEATIKVFRQMDPHDGDPVSQPTEAYLSYDSKNLYIGWICKDDPAKIRARVAPRKTIGGDDRVTINIDTFQDHKHAYWFDVNPYGVQYDGRTTDGIGDDSSWEALWYSEGRITGDGYAVLESIPFRSLRFPHAQKQIWYICLGRMIERNNEISLWPYISHQHDPQWVGQFAPIEIDDDISAGRNVQLIPYGLISDDRYLNATAGFKQENEHHPGLDAKLVLHDALTLDITVNPDFSEIGSDDPRVTANQRYEVIYPERRPFFLENASVFSTPEQLFFSRRIVDPQFGAKLTGSVNRWNLGVLTADDRAPGEVLALGVTGHGARGKDAVFRGEREFDRQSHVGLFLSDSSFQSSWNRVGSLDLRYLAPQNWTFTGQATTTQANDGQGGYQAGPGYVLGTSRYGPHFAFSSYYTDRSPGMTANLGYLNRVDIRYWETYSSYQWKPPAGHLVMAYGPTMDAVVNYDHENRLENWSFSPGISITLTKQTLLAANHGESYELYNGLGFRESYTGLYFGTAWYKWLSTGISYSRGSSPNYYPPAEMQPFLANFNNASASLTVRPQPHLRLDEIYYYSRLATRAGDSPAPTLINRDVFTNHVIRSKVNYQFTRDYSFNAIMDYNSLLPNAALVSSTCSKQADTTLLFTYLPHPGTAVYMGFSDTFQNVDYSAASTPAYSVTNLPGTSTDRQFFVKFSRLLRF